MNIISMIHLNKVDHGPQYNDCCGIWLVVPRRAKNYISVFIYIGIIARNESGDLKRMRRSYRDPRAAQIMTLHTGDR